MPEGSHKGRSRPERVKARLSVVDGNPKLTAIDLGIRHVKIHEARQIREAKAFTRAENPTEIVACPLRANSDRYSIAYECQLLAAVSDI